MSEETNKEAVEQQEMSPQEIKEMRKKMLNYYNEELPLLRKQEEFEKLSADINEHKVRNAVAISRYAYIMSGPAEGEGDVPEGFPVQEEAHADNPPVKKERKLKEE